MSAFVLQIAGFSIKINYSVADLTDRTTLLASLIKDRYPEFIVTSIDTLIDYTITFIDEEKLQSLTSKDRKLFFINLYYLKGHDKLVTFYHISLYQFELILLHVLQILLARNDGFFIHTSAIFANNSAHLFLGKSGAGKSTSSQLLKDYYPILSDDGAIIKKQGGDWFFYQTPFYEKNKIVRKTNTRYLLGKMFFLVKAETFQTNILKNKQQIINKLISQLYTQHEDVKKQVINLIKYINTHEEFYELLFKIDAEGLKNSLKDIL